MSGILAAAQSSGCCCRPQEGCTCSDPNRPGAIIDQGLTSVLVTSGFGIDEARRLNSSPSDCNGCPCSGFPLYGPYGYQAIGSVIDPDLAEGDCEGRGCTSGPCPSCPTYSCSSDVGSVVAHREQSFPFPTWRSRITFEGENRIGQWSWTPRQVGWCNPAGSTTTRIRRFCPFIYSTNGTQFGNLISDPNGAFIDASTGAYGNTPYGNTVGRVIAVAEAAVSGVGSDALGDPCSYYASVSVHYLTEWRLRRFLAEDFPPLSFDATYSALYRKPCQSPTDTVLGTYELVYDPEYDLYEQDPECGALRWFNEIRATVPRTLVVS